MMRNRKPNPIQTTPRCIVLSLLFTHSQAFGMKGSGPSLSNVVQRVVAYSAPNRLQN